MNVSGLVQNCLSILPPRSAHWRSAWGSTSEFQ
jgi:hypothetical protein